MFILYNVIEPLFCPLSVFSDLISFLSTLTWFWNHDYRKRSCSAWSEKYFDRIIMLLSYLVFDVGHHIGVILLFLVVFLTISFFGTSTWFLSVVNHGENYSASSEIHFEKQLFFTLYPVFNMWCHIVVTLPFSIILQLNFYLRP